MGHGLEEDGRVSIRMSFLELGSLLDFKLPQSAREHDSWWGNDNTHSQSIAWMEAGYRVIMVDLEMKVVVFERA